jgi:hypothetical protein
MKKKIMWRKKRTKNEEGERRPHLKKHRCVGKKKNMFMDSDGFRHQE